MKAYCAKEALLNGVNTVQRAVSSKNTLPILQGICVKATGQALIFEGTDLELGIRCQVPAQVVQEGVAVLPSRLFADIVRKLPDTTISLELVDDKVNFNYYQSNLAIKSYDPEEFPLMPDLLNSTSFSLPARLLKNMIRQTVFACSTDESRPVFTGVLVQVDGPAIRFVGTDTHRLAYYAANIDNPDGVKFHGIVPAKTFGEIYRLLREEDENIAISFNDAQIFFEFGPVQLLSRLIEGQFPNYNQVIPRSCQTKIKIKAREFEDAVERASLVAREGSGRVNIVKLKIEDQLLNIEQTTDIGKISEQVDIEKQGNDLAIAFNAKFLLDVLKVVDSEDVLFELSGPISPGVIRPMDETDYLYLVLPVRNA